MPFIAQAEVEFDANGTPLAILHRDGRGGKLPLVSGAGMFAFNPSQMKKWRAALARMQSGGANAKLAFLGDSTDVGVSASGASYAGNFVLAPAAAVATLLAGRGYSVNTASRFGTGNVGTGATISSYDPRMGVIPAAWGPASVSVGGPYFTNTSDTSKLLFQPPAPYTFDTIDVWYYRTTGNDSFEIAVDGGASLATTNSNGAASVQKVTVSTTLANHVVNIYKTNANAAPLAILAINCYKSATPAIDVWNWGYSGATANTFSAGGFPHVPASAIPVYAPDLTILNLTINDIQAVTDLATYTANLQTIINKCKQSGDVILRSGNPISAGTAPTSRQDSYVAAMSALALANGIPYVDIYGRFVSWTDANALGLITDAVHPFKIGYQDMANALLPYIAP